MRSRRGVSSRANAGFEKAITATVPGCDTTVSNVRQEGGVPLLLTGSGTAPFPRRHSYRDQQKIKAVTGFQGSTRVLGSPHRIQDGGAKIRFPRLGWSTTYLGVGPTRKGFRRPAGNSCAHAGFSLPLTNRGRCDPCLLYTSDAADD